MKTDKNFMAVRRYSLFNEQIVLDYRSNYLIRKRKYVVFISKSGEK